MPSIARHLSISGRVQGVFFRAWTRDLADRLSVKGWVRNCPDGHVEAHLEGDAAAIEQMIERLHDGPPAAEVENLRVWDADTFGYDGFEVRH